MIAYFIDWDFYYRTTEQFSKVDEKIDNLVSFSTAKLYNRKTQRLALSEMTGQLNIKKNTASKLTSKILLSLWLRDFQYTCLCVIVASFGKTEKASLLFFSSNFRKLARSSTVKKSRLKYAIKNIYTSVDRIRFLFLCVKILL